MDNKIEQADSSVSKIGKFNTAEDLLSAYNALESEFTKRCQLVKRLQTELNTAKSAQADNDSFVQNQPVDAQTAQAVQAADRPICDGSAGQIGASNVDSGETGSPDAPRRAATATEDRDVLDEIVRHACDYAEILSAIPEVSDACIARYKQKLISTGGIGGGSPQGMAVIMPAVRPKTLSDAKRIADEMLK